MAYKKAKGKRNVKLYISTDCYLNLLDILEYYLSRFQTEFYYRDGKQFTGLCDSKVRNGNYLHFHFIATLTAINIVFLNHLRSNVFNNF